MSLKEYDKRGKAYTSISTNLIYAVVILLLHFSSEKLLSILSDHMLSINHFSYIIQGI